MVTMKCTGDVLMITPPTDRYWNENPLVEYLKKADFLAGNLEMVLCEDTAYASTFCGGVWLSASKNRIEELKKYHYQYFNIANNHTMDFSSKGADDTCRVLKENHFSYSGYGRNLEEASAASYVTANGQKAAFISCTASCDDAARAGNPSPTIPGRPGVNMLRHKETLYVEPRYMETIDKIAELTCVNARFMKSVRMGVHALPPEVHRLGRLEFVESDSTYKHTSCNRVDLQRILDQIDLAKANNAEIIAVSVHSHDIKGMTDDTADDYLEEFAHCCVDRGASIVIGTGTHQLKGIEVYKNSPIFYSLGNFVFKYEQLEYVPSDYYDRYHLPYSSNSNELWNAVSKNNTIGLQFDEANYLSIVPSVTFDKGRVSHVELLPIELGFHGSEREKGFPYIANKEQSNKIYARLLELSKPYGTSLELEGNMIKLCNIGK